jgi:hypothetical protein
MKQELLATIVFSFLIMVSLAPLQSGASEGQQAGQGPVIFDSYASSTVRPGNSWRVYLRARDEGGNMKSIVAVLSGPGSPTQTSITWLKKNQSQEIAGYLFLRTPADTNILNRNYTLQIFVRDSKENKSEAVEFPLSFDLKKRAAELPAKWQDVADNKIGAIMIDIGGERERMEQGLF